MSDRLDHIAALIKEEVQASALKRVSQLILDEAITPEAFVAMLDEATNKEQTNFFVWTLFAYLAEKGRMLVRGCDPDEQEGLFDLAWEPELSTEETIVFEPHDEHSTVGVWIMPAYDED